MSKVKVHGQEIKFCILFPNKDSNQKAILNNVMFNCKTSDIRFLFQKGQGQGRMSNKTCNAVLRDI